MKKQWMNGGKLFALSCIYMSIANAAFAASDADTTLSTANEVELPTMNITGSRSVATKKQLPVTIESVTQQKMADTINVVNTEDAVKYLPSVMVRKRHIGDTYAPIATRTSGLGQSARSLIFADGVLLSALIGSNNGSASPRWGMVAPEEIERVDIMYGPFSAAYAGNSIGAVVEMTTRMPQKFEASVKMLTALQNASWYGTSGNYASNQLSATLGNRNGRFSWWLSGNHLHGKTQPISIATAAKSTTQPATPGLGGGYAGTDKFGAPIAIVGAGGIENKSQDNLKVKLGFDFTPTLSGTYTVGVFQNDVDSKMQSYLTDAAGNPAYPAANSGLQIGADVYQVTATSLSGGMYKFKENHLMQSVAMKSNTQGTWDWEAVASVYDFGHDNQHAPKDISSALSGTGAGTNTKMDGTGWNTLDVKGMWRPEGITGTHLFSFGAHRDQAKLRNTKYNVTTDWVSEDTGVVATESLGKTQTNAVWLQDVIEVAPDMKATLGGRYENWRAFDGRNYSLSPASDVTQPGLSTNKFSPKASLAWAASDQWMITGSMGVASRFPTVGELYQAVTTGTTITTPNPNLRPENAVSTELAFERSAEKSKLRVSLFREDLSDALISQRNLLAPATYGNSVTNVDKVRSMGVEIVAQREDVFVRGLELSGSITQVDSEIVADNTFRVGSALVNVSGKRTPNIPDWRAKLVATYRPNDKLALTLAGQYSGRLWTTLDNTDKVTSTYQGFDSYFVMDARANYKIDQHWNAAVGIDNLNNRRYWLFHPFPQRTYFADVKYTY